MVFNVARATLTGAAGMKGGAAAFPPLATLAPFPEQAGISAAVARIRPARPRRVEIAGRALHSVGRRFHCSKLGKDFIHESLCNSGPHLGRYFLRFGR